MDMKKRPIIIDCDTGTDDAIAILAAFYTDEVEVKAITSVNGNVGVVHTSQNNLNIVEYLGKDIPVATGAAMPFGNAYADDRSASGTHGKTGMGNVQIPKAGKRKLDARTASELIYETAVSLKGELELVVIGPMTNIAIALINHPDLPDLIKHIWFMGGAVIGGNVTSTAEFNIWVDPEAARIVIGSKIPKTMVGLDVTERAILTKADANELRLTGSKETVLAADLLEFMFTRWNAGGEDAMMHDALALAAAVCPACLTCRDYFVDVECKGEYTYGHTMVDRKGKLRKSPNTSVAVDVDVEMFRRWLLETLKKSVKN